jgi:purine nucleosidase
VFTILNVTGRRIPVYRGAVAPLVGDWEAETPDVHGNDGLGNWRDRPPTVGEVEREPAALALVCMANEAPGELTLLALGPLTNLALAARIDPEFPSKIRRFVFMGGTHMGMGNTANAAAEWNIFCDPEAAAIVLNAFPQSSMITWEATVFNTIPWVQFDPLMQYDTPVGRLFAGISRHQVDHQKADPKSRGFLIPDPLAMAYTLQPELALEKRDHYVTVEVGGRHARGQTILDHYSRSKRQPNCTVVTKFNIDGVVALFQKALS